MAVMPKIRAAASRKAWVPYFRAKMLDGKSDGDCHWLLMRYSRVRAHELRHDGVASAEKLEIEATHAASSL